ncbi:GNAT family N-acetyltransferase [Streptomyces sp. NBC_00654]|uniref:GNAT family N-acetyltransferase n=1 Tax=Streptomyces sp. NBC_00654 TaxID=2975799 RepID=UPI002256D0A6|nr:GNAT family N-acetyltransferase [Streptomyces sp. NBC_00654]MCX4970319.1 GNAT family N-acetyltransferase [Streptomyces sp. NBC_00654]
MTDLETARLILHPLSDDEARELLAAGSEGRNGPGARAGWAEGYPMDGDVSAARKFLGSRTEDGVVRHPGAYEIRRRDDGVAIGGVDFHGPADESGSVTIGYGLVPAVRGKGYASEALRALLEYARTSGIAARVKGDADHGNTASQHVMAAAGMRRVGADERVTYYEISWGDGAPTRGRDEVRPSGAAGNEVGHA